MKRFRVTVTRTIWLEAEIEAEDAADAREIAQSGQSAADWTDADFGRGLGDDDYTVLDVEELDEEVAEDEDDQPEETA